MEAEIDKDGGVTVEGHHVGRLAGFQFAPDVSGDGPDGKALRAAAAKALAGEIETRANRFVNAGDGDVVLASDGAVRWQGELVGRLAKGDKTLAPKVRILADEQLTGEARDKVEKRLDQWIRAHVQKLLGPLQELESAEDVTGIARGVAFQVIEELGVLERAKVSEDVKSLDQPSRAALRKHGVRFGAHHIYLPALIKPAPRALAAQLWALGHDSGMDAGVGDVAHLAAAGRTSMTADAAIDKGLYRALGYQVCGPRAIRVDILERLADLIRPAIAWKPGQVGSPPPGAFGGNGFTVTVAMTSLAGCSGEDFAAILRALGYRMELRPKPADAPKPVAAPRADAQSETADTPAVAEPVDVAETVEAAAPDLSAPDTSTDAGPASVDDAVEAAAAEESLESTEPNAGDDIPADAPVFDAGDAEPQLLDPASSDEVPPETSLEPLDGAPEVAEPTADDAEAAAEAQVEAAEDATPDLPALDAAAPGEDAAAGEAGGETAKAEPEMVEVWRPGGFGRREPRRDHRRPEGAPREDRRGPRPAGGGRHRPAGDAAAATAGAASAGPQPDGPREAGAPDRQRHGGGRHEGGARPGEGGGKPWEKRGDGKPREGRPGGGGRDERGGGRGRPRREEFDRQHLTSSPPPKRQDRAIDPDSPFAKLAALKAQLEGSKRGGDGSGG